MLSNVAYAVGRVPGNNAGSALGKRSDAHSRVGSAHAANSALANSDMDGANGLAESDASYNELTKLQ